jgi:hypothetical protein
MLVLVATAGSATSCWAASVRTSLVPRAAADTCQAATPEIGTLPYGPISDTTVGSADDFDLPADLTDPTCTAPTSCTGGGEPSSLPRGAIYTGTGTGPDRAYRVQTSADCTLTITADPTSSEDLSLIVYETTCSSSLADCACVNDAGNAGDAETVTLNAIAGADYFIVVDGYAGGPGGPFTLTIDGTGCELVSNTTTTTSTTSTSTTTLPLRVCASGTIEDVIVRLAKLGSAAGNERLRLEGSIAAGAPVFDPTNLGAALVVEDLSSGSVLYELTAATNPVPGGARGTGCHPKDGWKNGTYRNRSGSLDPPTCTAGTARGLKLLTFRDERSTGGGIVFRAAAKNASIPDTAGPLRVTVMLSAAAAAGPNGQCGTVSFGAERCRRKGSKLVCR